MSQSVADVLRTLPAAWRQAADALEREGACEGARAIRRVADETELALAGVRPTAGATTRAALPPNATPLLTESQAAVYLGLSERHLQTRADIPRLDVGAPGAARPMWRYRVADLEAFAAGRLVLPYTKRVA